MLVDAWTEGRGAFGHYSSGVVNSSNNGGCFLFGLENNSEDPLFSLENCEDPLFSLGVLGLLQAGSLLVSG